MIPVAFLLLLLSSAPTLGADKSGSGQSWVPTGCVWFPPSQHLQPMALVSCTPDFFLSVRDAKTNETDSSLDPEGASPPPCKPIAARRYTSVPDLSHSNLLSCPGLELSQPISRIEEVKSASAVNIFPSTGVSRAVYLPRGLCSLRGQW